MNYKASADHISESVKKEMNQFIGRKIDQSSIDSVRTAFMNWSSQVRVNESSITDAWSVMTIVDKIKWWIVNGLFIYR